MTKKIITVENDKRSYTFPVNEPGTGCFLHCTIHCSEFEVIQKKDEFIRWRYVSALFELGERRLIEIKNDKIRIGYVFDEKYRYIMLFNSGSNGKYVCVEPQSRVSNCPHFENREQYGFSVIKPSDEITYEIYIYCE